MIKKETSKKAPKLPNIYRFITERAFQVAKNRKAIVTMYSALFLIMICIITYLSLNFYQNLKSYQNVSSERAVIISQIRTWQGIVKKYPDFKDAYLQIAVLEYRLKDYKKARFYCDKALLLDPEYSDAIELNKRLEGK